MPSKKARELWVVKAGSNMVLEGGSLLIREWMRQVHQLQEAKRQAGTVLDVIWVTSGAIAMARHEMDSPSKAAVSMAEKQAFSAVGQPLVLDQYNLALQILGRRAAQVLLTAEDLQNRTRRKNLIATLRTLLRWNVLPVLNENDTVSTTEIQFGDNDRLSALVARAMGASKLILLTDVDGLFDKDPRRHPPGGKDGAQLISFLAKKQLTSKFLSTVSSASLSGRGRGGMLSKLMAAKEAGKDGIDVHLVRGDRADAIAGCVSAGYGTKIGVKP